MKIHIYSVILLESVLLCAIAYNLLKTTRRSAGIRILNDINYKLHVSSSSLSSSLSSASNIINSVTLYVKDINKSISFYSGGIGLQQVHRDGSNDDAAFCLLDDSLIKLKQITLLDAVDVGDSLVGIGVVRSNAVDIMDASEMNGGSVHTILDNYAYAASLIPDEDEMKQYPVKYGRVADPDGYLVEILEPLKAPPSTGTTFTTAKVILNVEDLDESIEFYTDILGMTLYRKRANINGIPKEASFIAYVGYSSESDGAHLELVYNYACEKLNHGSAAKHDNQLEITVSNFSSVVETLREKSIEYLTNSDGSIVVEDPNKYKVLVSPSRS